MGDDLRVVSVQKTTEFSLLMTYKFALGLQEERVCLSGSPVTLYLRQFCLLPGPSLYYYSEEEICTGYFFIICFIKNILNICDNNTSCPM
jgi:hypothetical protein